MSHIYHGLDEVPPGFGPSVVAIGNFDGVHRGHQEILRTVICEARTRSARAVAITFDPHPDIVLRPARAPQILTPMDQRARLLLETGIDAVVVLPFDLELAKLSAREFLERVVVRTLGAIGVHEGENFRFGHKAQGDPRLLAGDGRFETVVHPLLEVDGEIVSSSHIRGLVLAGELGQANHLLGAPFQLQGDVVHGDERGRELGFPTANLIPDEALLYPGHGVYACLSDGRPAAVSIGVRPTFQTGRAELVEAFIVDFEGDLYGSRLRLEFLERLRGERRVGTPADLVAQMHRDVERTREAVAAQRPLA